MIVDEEFDGFDEAMVMLERNDYPVWSTEMEAHGSMRTVVVGR